MRLTMNERRSVVKAMAPRYRKAGKKDKGRLLDELVALTGYHRCYAIGLLRGHGRRHQLIGKQCRGSKVKKTYDRPQTPYQRLLASPVIGPLDRRRLQAQYATLNPAELKCRISRLQYQLLKNAARPPPPNAHKVGRRPSLAGAEATI